MTRSSKWRKGRRKQIHVPRWVKMLGSIGILLGMGAGMSALIYVVQHNDVDLDSYCKDGQDPGTHDCWTYFSGDPLIYTVLVCVVWGVVIFAGLYIIAEFANWTPSHK